MEHALIRVIGLIVFIIIGHLLKRFSILKEEAFQVLSCLVLYITLPCLIISSINGISITYDLLSLVLLGLLCNILMTAIGYWINRKNTQKEQIFSMLNLSGYNIGLFSMPFVAGFLPPVGFLATCLFDAGNAIMCTGGTYAVVKSMSEGGRQTSFKDFFQKVFSSVSFCIYFIMIPMALFHLSFPAPVMIFTKIAGDANAFLCMIMIGVNINLHLDQKSFKLLLNHIVIRYAVAAILSVLFYNALPFSPEVRKAMAIIAFAPTSSIAIIFTFKMKGDVFMAGTINSVSILLSVITMTFLLLYL